jgi:hypothetical protein
MNRPYQLSAKTFSPVSYERAFLRLWYNTTMTTTKSQTDFGPLTTTFIPPSDCFMEKWMHHSSRTAELFWGWGCYSAKYGYAIQDAKSCFPTGFGIGTTTASTVNLNRVFTSASICPSGWGASYISTYGATDNPSTNYNLTKNSVTMVEGDILTACCPS